VAFKKPWRTVNRIFIHCSASDYAHHDDVSVMRKWHKQRGWSDVGYHFFIKKDGTLQKGRALNKIPAAQRGHNNKTIAICLHGLKKSKFTKEQFKTLRKLCKEINDAYNQKVTFHGHCEVSSKDCPVFDYKDVLKLDKKGNLGL
jgi:N-acetyl-anhydromuramyl-L-alanine amidase AmpD